MEPAATRPSLGTAAAAREPHGSSGGGEASQNDELSNLTGSDIEEDMTWIEWFCGLKGNEMFVFVDEEFVRDDFNLTGLSTQVPYYDKALSLIVEGDLSDDSPSDAVSFAYIEKSAALLFGLIHARFVLTAKGLGLLQQKVGSQFYAKTCPNALCSYTCILPSAVTDTPNIHTVKLFCSRCNELYHPPRSSFLNSIDGAFFGTSVAALFFMAYPQLLPPLPKAGVALQQTSSSSSDKRDLCSLTASGAASGPEGGSRTAEGLAYYIPKVFGFKVHPDGRRLAVQREETTRRRREASAAPISLANAAAAAVATPQQQQQQAESDKWYASGTGSASLAAASSATYGDPGSSSSRPAPPAACSPPPAPPACIAAAPIKDL